MASKFQQVELATIEEGKFMADCEKAFRKIQDALIKHCRRYSSDDSVKASLDIKVEIIGKDGAFAIKTSVNEKTPGRPKVATPALPEESTDGRGFGLFAQSSGTSKGNPRQKKFATEDGRIVGADGRVDEEYEDVSDDDE